MAIGCNGTNVTGRPLQRFVCLLHANELQLKHLIIELDGVTRCPKLFYGSIGSLLPTCEKLPVAP